MAAAAEENATKVQTLTGLLEGQFKSMGNLEATVANLQTSVGSLTTGMAGLTKKMDLLLTSMANQAAPARGAMGAGRDREAGSVGRDGRSRSASRRAATGETCSSDAGSSDANSRS